MPYKIKTNSYSTSSSSATTANSATSITSASFSSSASNPHHIIDPSYFTENTNINKLISNSSSSISTESNVNTNCSNFSIFSSGNNNNTNYNNSNNNNSNNSNITMNNNKQINMLKRNAASFDDGYNSSVLMGSGYSSSTRSSISPTSSLSFQFRPSDIENTYFDPDMTDSPVGDDSTCSSTFHIDSPPSKAEFCQYFHAASSSLYCKSAIETGFAQLTLTDDEQRELYEAALVIQNAYRRYVQRKKKKIKLDIDPILTSASGQSTSSQFKDTSLSRSSSTSLSSLASSTSSSAKITNESVKNYPLINMIKQTNFSNNLISDSNATLISCNQSSTKNQDQFLGILTDDEEINSNRSGDNKQYQAACVIQKYYRRYKQVEFCLLKVYVFLFTAF